MNHTLTLRLEELSKWRHEEPTQIIAEALELGLSRLYLDSVLKQYLKKKISRNKAIRLVGLDFVKLADQQHQIVQKDIAWGLGHG